MKPNWIILPLVTAILVSTLARAEHLATPRVAVEGQLLQLSDWLVIGPFGGQQPWEHDYLSDLGDFSETGDVVSYEKAAEVLASRRRQHAILPFSRISLLTGNSPFVDFNALFERPYLPVENPSAAYVGCVLTAKEAREAYLLAGSSEAEKIWLNGKLLPNQITKRGISTYDDSFKITLNQGNNFILIKVAKWARTTWGVTAMVAPDAATAVNVAIERTNRGRIEGMFLSRNAVIAGVDALKIVPSGVPVGFRLRVRIVGQNREISDQWMEKGNDAWKLPADLRAGLYYAQLYAPDGTSYRESFAVGELEPLSKQLGDSVAALHLVDQDKMNLDALLRRLTILMNPDNRRFTSEGVQRDWERKTVHIMGELSSALARLKEGNEAFKDIPGLHIRAFRSNIDGQEQHYRLYVPTSYKRKGSPQPLIVLLPTVLSANRPFIESVFMAGHSEAERIAAIAERYGMAILWSGYRNRPTGQPCEMTHIDETLRAVCDDYRIDPARISMMGACSGGGISTRAVVQWPERFAGVALLNPTFGLLKVSSPGDAAPFLECPAFLRWTRDRDVVDEFLKLRSTPTYIIHDGAEPGHGDLGVSMEFAQRASAKSYPLRFERSVQTLSQHFGAWEDLIAWLSLQKRVAPNERRSPRLAPPTVADALADRFILVEGTGGSDSDRASVQALVAQFQRNWKATHFGECRVIRDSDFNNHPDDRANLILVGNAVVNSTWKALGELSAGDLTDTTVRLDGVSWAGKNLAIQSVHRSPNNPDRLIVFLGASDLRNAKFDKVDLSSHGWFHVAVWDGKEETLVHAE